MGGICSSQMHRTKDESEMHQTKDESCDNGHIVCSTCCPKLENKCQKCSLHISPERCKGIEILLLSIIGMPCPNIIYGCKEKISLIENRNHEDECIHMPCKCPLLKCDFIASSKDLSIHFSSRHGDFLTKFSYCDSFFVSLNSNHETIFLQEENDGTLFILNNSVTVSGNAINICYIGPKSSKLEYLYYIRVRVPSEKYPSEFQSFARSVQRFASTTLSSKFLVVPFDSSRALEREICIMSPTIQIVVMTLTGSTIPLMVKRSDTILDVKMKIQDELGWPLHQQRLIYGGKQLQSRRTVASYNIQEKAKIIVTLRLHGS